MRPLQLTVRLALFMFCTCKHHLPYCGKIVRDSIFAIIVINQIHEVFTLQNTKLNAIVKFSFVKFFLLYGMSPWPICLFVCDDTYLCAQDERKLFICTIRCSVCSSVCLSACHTQPVEGTPGAVTLGVCFVDTCIGIFHVSSTVVWYVTLLGCWLHRLRYYLH